MKAGCRTACLKSHNVPISNREGVPPFETYSHGTKGNPEFPPEDSGEQPIWGQRRVRRKEGEGQKKEGIEPPLVGSRFDSETKIYKPMPKKSTERRLFFNRFWLIKSFG